MAVKPVAVTGDVEATPGKIPFPDAVKGDWTADPVTYKAYDHLTIGGKSVIHGASCTFRFEGERSNGSKVIGDEEVNLTAGATVLQGALSGVLCNNDKLKGKFGNQLEVKTTNVLKSN
jgi:hypothetical protein